MTNNAGKIVRASGIVMLVGIAWVVATVAGGAIWDQRLKAENGVGLGPSRLEMFSTLFNLGWIVIGLGALGVLIASIVWLSLKEPPRPRA